MQSTKPVITTAKPRNRTRTRTNKPNKNLKTYYYEAMYIHIITLTKATTTKAPSDSLSPGRVTTEPTDSHDRPGDPDNPRRGTGRKYGDLGYVWLGFGSRNEERDWKGWAREVVRAERGQRNRT